jgi:paraquat-inducible protein A
MSATGALTARRAGLVGCHLCGRLYRHLCVEEGGHEYCRVCGSELHERKPDSLARTWALVLTGALLYIPANLLPIMTVVFSGHGEPDTIISGVFALLRAGSWGIALLILFASIVVPLLKLLGLVYLLLSVQLRWRWRPRDRTVLYRLIENVGRWSMLDIFVVAILVALVKLGAVATIEPGAGATCFGAVVVITMLASASFDPRLIWDALEEDR